DVDAASIKFALDRVYDKNNPFNATTGPFPFAFELGPITGTEAPAKDTLVVHLAAPYSPMLTMLASSIGGLAGASPAAVQGCGRGPSRGALLADADHAGDLDGRARRRPAGRDQGIRQGILPPWRRHRSVQVQALGEQPAGRARGQSRLLAGAAQAEGARLPPD